MSVLSRLMSRMKTDYRPVSRTEPALIRAASPENPSTNLSNPAEWLVDWAGGGTSASGVPVSPQSAMRTSAVYACVDLLSGLVASLPLKVYRKTKDGREEASDQPLYRLLHDEPNPRMGSFKWRELIMVNLLLRGNHYSLIETNGRGEPSALIPLNPDYVEPFMSGGNVYYQVRDENGTTDILRDEDVLHVAGLGFDGLKGLSPISWAAKNAVGLSISLEDFTAKAHANGVRPSGVLEIPNKISQEGLTRLRLEFERLHAGTTNTGRIVVTDAGSKWSPMKALDPVDAQTLEARRFQVTDIARVYGVPPFMIGETDKSTSWGTGIEQMMMGFLIVTLNRWLSRIEDELSRKLFWSARYKTSYPEFHRDALLAMDAKSRGDFIASMIQNAVMTPNEARTLQNMPRVEGADKLFIASNLVPIDKAGEKEEAVVPASEPESDDKELTDA